MKALNLSVFYLKQNKEMSGGQQITTINAICGKNVVEKKEVKLESKQEILFEPNADEILNTLVPMALKSSLYSLWMETKTSEQASRRLAMENATDNAEELKDKLVLQFNQARQAAITQEITEIVAGADSL